MPLRAPKRPKLAKFAEPAAFRPPRVPGGVGRPRGPRALTQVLRPPEPPWRNPPPNWPPAGSTGEWAVYWALTRVLRKRDGGDFIYQGRFLGGRQELGGVVPDFVMIDGTSVAINVDSLFFHTGTTAEQANDVLDTALLAARGFTLVHLWENDLLGPSGPVHLVRLALQGIEPPIGLGA
jgi:hypothetical protein